MQWNVCEDRESNNETKFAAFGEGEWRIQLVQMKLAPWHILYAPLNALRVCVGPHESNTRDVSKEAENSRRATAKIKNCAAGPKIKVKFLKQGRKMIGLTIRFIEKLVVRVLTFVKLLVQRPGEKPKPV